MTGYAVRDGRVRYRAFCRSLSCTVYKEVRERRAAFPPDSQPGGFSPKWNMKGFLPSSTLLVLLLGCLAGCGGAPTAATSKTSAKPVTASTACQGVAKVNSALITLSSTGE